MFVHVPREIPAVIGGATSGCRGWTGASRADYSYLLGLYLGDGYVGRMARTFSLVISCDVGHPGMIQEGRHAVDQFAPRPSSVQTVPNSNEARIVSYSKIWPLLFPQFGSGRKHNRKIELVSWQQEIVDVFPEKFLRGLIHSDGSRCQNTFTIQMKGGPREYSYPRYFFTNYSEDIRRIFTDTCDQIDVRWTLSNWRNVSISHRDSVAFLDTFIGPKF